MRLPKFHSKNSLYFGVLAGVFLVYSGMFHKFGWVGIIQMLIGLVLAVHCWDMLRIYKKHRILKIEKTETHKVITKE